MTETRTSDVLAPIFKVVTVNAAPGRAFDRFTREIGSWWPLESHSVGEGETETVAMDGRVGGRIVERMRDGREAVWGTITVWDPPRRVAFTWHPGNEPEQSTNVEVRFSAHGSRTRVELRHAGFERLGPRGARIRKLYPLGWTYVLGLYAEQRGPVLMLLKGVTTALMAIRRRKLERARVRARDVKV